MIFAGLNLAFAGVTAGQSELELEAATKRAVAKKPPSACAGATSRILFLNLRTKQTSS